MRKHPRRVLVLHEDRVFREQLLGVKRRGDLDVIFVAGWEDLADALRAAPASTVVVVDPYAEGGSGASLSIELAALINRYSSVPVTAAIHVATGRLDDVRKLGEWGVVEIIDLEEEASATAIRQRLLYSRARPLQRLVEARLPTYTSGAARSILKTAVAVALDGGVGTELARAFHITPRTLHRWCRRASLPPPRRVMAWMRVLLATELLDDTGRTVSDAALACGYASDGSLRQALKGFLGESPTRLREVGAFTVAAKAFTRELIEARATDRRYRQAR